MLIDGGVNVALTGEEIKGFFYLVLGHLPLGNAEDRIHVHANILRALIDEVVHQVVVFVTESLVREGGGVARLNSYLNWASSKNVDVL